jgi:5-methylcytosine-specific restriction protein A
VEAEIARLAGECGPRKLRSLGVEVIAHADHDAADAEPEPQVNELRITSFPGGGGKIEATFTDPVRFNQILAVIDAKSAPLTKDDTRTTPERQADALAEVCGFVAEHGDSKVLPDGLARRPQVSLIVEEKDLENRLRAGCLAFGGIASPGELRRICCDAAVIPIVMNGASQPLDVGTRQRTIPRAIRWAVEARDRGCAHPGCDRPPSWSEVHHIKHWADGGPTALWNLVMLCKVHHRSVHDGDWIIRMGTDGLPEFIPPEWVDSTRTPRRNPRPNLMGVS